MYIIVFFPSKRIWNATQHTHRVLIDHINQANESISLKMCIR